MKNKLVLSGLLISVLAIGIIAVGCASTPAGPAYPFDGTSWTKSEEAELTFSASEGAVTIGGTRVAWGTNPKGTLNADGTLTIGGTYANGWGHYTGTWTLKSGTPASGSLAGTVWSRTEAQTMRLAGSTVTILNGESPILPAKKYTATDTRLRVSLDNGPASVNYTVDGSTLTISNASSQTWDVRRIAGTWTKQ
jgi:hypothetical protein